MSFKTNSPSPLLTLRDYVVKGKGFTIEQDGSLVEFGDKVWLGNTRTKYRIGNTKCEDGGDPHHSQYYSILSLALLVHFCNVPHAQYERETRKRRTHPVRLEDRQGVIEYLLYGTLNPLVEEPVVDPRRAKNARLRVDSASERPVKRFRK